MNPALEKVLLALEPSALTFCSPEEWEMVKAEVLGAGAVSKASPSAQIVLKAAKRQFASRSEAGRYAATMRWRGSNPGGLEAAQAQARETAVMGGKEPAIGNEPVPALDSAKIVARYEAKYGGPEYKAQLKSAKVYELADEVRAHLQEQGKKVPPSAKPYLDAMDELSDVKDNYGADSGKSVVAYAMSNLKFYGTRGKAIKAEMKSRIS
jgi:hypothetical protein